jgi:phage/plasmid primase-like uncharacterized protein
MGGSQNPLILRRGTSPFCSLLSSGNQLSVTAYGEKEMSKRDSTKLKRQMEGRWISAFLALAPSLEHAINKLGTNVSCPVDGGVDGFRLFQDANITGGGAKQSWRVIPEGIDMLMWVNEWSFTKAYDELEAFLANKAVDAGPVRHSTPKPIDETKLRAWLNQVWKESLPLTDLRAYPARAYFERRRIKSAALAASDIRYHPLLNYKAADGQIVGRYGAVVALVRNNDGMPVSIHRTFLTKSGMKVDFLGRKNAPRKLTPAVNKKSKGRQVRLSSALQDGIVGVAEGLETALAVTEATGFPVWPTIATSMLTSFIPPNGVKTVVIFADKDTNLAGEIAANTLTERLTEVGVNVITLLPPTPILESDTKGVDWADQLLRDREGFAPILQMLDKCSQIERKIA